VRNDAGLDEQRQNLPKGAALCSHGGGNCELLTITKRILAWQ
jgi:hypothetical protein